MKHETFNDFEIKMQRLQATMTADEYDQTIGDFWDYIHIVNQ